MRKLILLFLVLSLFGLSAEAATEKFDVRGDIGDLFLFVAATRVAEQQFAVEFVITKWTLKRRFPGRAMTIVVFRLSGGVSCRVDLDGSYSLLLRVFPDSKVVIGKASKEEKRACKQAAKRYFVAVWQEIYRMRARIRTVWVQVRDVALQRDLSLAIEARELWEVVDNLESADAILYVYPRRRITRSPSAYVIHEGHVGNNTSVVTVDEVGGGINLSYGYVVQLLEKDSTAAVFSSCSSPYDCGKLYSLSKHLDRIRKELEYARSQVP